MSSSLSSEAESLNRLAVQLQAQGRSRESLDAFQRATKLYQAAGDRVGEGRCLNGVGALFKDLGEPQEAKDYLERALVLRRQTGDRLGEAITLITLGPVYQRLAQLERGRECLVEALRLTRELGHREREGEALFNLGEVTSDSGRPAHAYALFQQALAIAQEAGNLIEGNKCLNALSIVCQKLGKQREARAYAFQTLKIAQTTGNPRMLSGAYHNLGVLLAGTNQNDIALKCFEQAVDIDLKTGASGQAARSMLYVAGSYVRVDVEKARGFANQALEIARQLGDESLTACALTSLAMSFVWGQEPDAALPVLAESLNLVQRLGEQDGEGNVIYAMALAHDALGECETAFAEFEQAIALFEQHYTEIESRDLRLSYFNAFSIQNIYLVYTSRLIKYSQQTNDRSYAARAFHICERRHARDLREFLKVQRDPDHEITAPLTSITPPTLAQVQQTLLDSDTVLLQYSVHDQVTFAWVITCDDYAVVALEDDSLLVSEKVEKFRQALAACSESHVALGHELYQTLIGPVERYLESKRHLLIVPDLSLHLLPFQTLLTETGSPGSELPYLIRKYTVAYAPSAAIFDLLQTAKPRMTAERRELIAFAPVDFPGESSDTRLASLPGTINEVQSIAALFDSGRTTLKMFAAATKQTVLTEQLDQFRFLHFATHGFVNPEDLDACSIVLRGNSESDPILRTSDIANLQLDADLVVLSACETALGEVKYGEGILGLARAFYCAGARAVCASMWKVNDAATALLMVRFYEEIVKNGRSKTEALRSAQLSLLDSGKWSAPHFWAAFVLSGAWN